MWKDWTGVEWQLDPDSGQWFSTTSGENTYSLWSVYGAPGVYNGPLDWAHRPSPPEQDGQPSRQEPWQWRRARAELDLEVDYEGLLQQAFQPRLGPS